MVYLTRFSVTQVYTVLNGRMIRKKNEQERMWKEVAMA